MNLLYDGDGNRVSKTVAGTKTLYRVDTLNPTGYAQIIAEEAQNTAPTVPYVYGLERILSFFLMTFHMCRASVDRLQFT